MVGSRFCDLTKNIKLIKADLNGELKVDLTKPDSLQVFFKENEFHAVILFSAFTDVDQAEIQRGDTRGIAWKINVDGVKNIVDLCKSTKRKLIFISTDFVFDGQKGPYSEDQEKAKDSENVSWYGFTKIKAEQFIEENITDYLIVRISYPYRGPFKEKEDFAKQILKKYQENSLYPMFFDQKLTPTFVDDLAAVIDFLLKNDLKGIYHVASPKVTTPYEFALKLLNKFVGKTLYLKKGSIKDILGGSKATPRPIFGGLKTDKIRQLGLLPTPFDLGIDKIYDQSNGKLI